MGILKRILKHKVLAAALGVAVLAGGYWYLFAKNGGTAAPQYATTKVARGTLVVSVTGSGQISASNQTSIQAQGSGNVVSIAIDNNQKVSAGDLLVKLDPTNDERAARNAEANLESAQLTLQILEQPATTSTLLQAQQAVVQAEQNLTTDNNNLATDYNGAYTDISNTFIDIPGVMTGLNGVLYSTAVNKSQADIDAYTNMVSLYASNVSQYNQSAASGYQTALAAYNQNLADYKNSSVYSSTSTVESLLDETYATLKAISVANSSVKNLLDLVNNYLQQNNQKIPAQLTIDETNVQSYITTTNNHLSTINQIQNSLRTDKQAITTATLAVQQTNAALAQLQNGPTALDIQTKELAVTQAKNALADAKQNLENDYVRAPYGGIVTNINAKIGQPASGVLATLLTNTQLAQATLNEVDIVSVKVGQKATITFDALPNLSLTGKVSEVDTLGTIVQGVVSYNVQVALDAPNASVKPGMSDTVSIITNIKPDTLLVPNSAVTTRQGASTVQVMGPDGSPRQTQVAIGLVNDTMTEILSGLNEGDTIVTKTVRSSAAAQTQNAQNSVFGITGVGGGGGGAGLRRFGN